MRKRFNELKNIRLMSIDGVIGKVIDLLIDDDRWDIRYLVVAVENTLPTRRVLISPAAVEGYDFANRIMATSLSSQQVLDSPRLDHQAPISRQYEEALVEHYGWPIYWLGRAVQLSPQKLSKLASNDATQVVHENESANLRSAQEICGYQIVANNGDAGHMRDLVINLDSWTVDYATADPSTWLPSESSMFSAKHVRKIDWSDRQIFVDLRKQVLEPTSNPHPLVMEEPWSSQQVRPSL